MNHPSTQQPLTQSERARLFDQVQIAFAALIPLLPQGQGLTINYPNTAKDPDNWYWWAGTRRGDATDLAVEITVRL